MCPRAPSLLSRAGYPRRVIPAVDQASVSLLRWLRRQLRQSTPLREHLEAAVAHDDPVEARRLLALFPFSPEQRRHVEGTARSLGGGASLRLSETPRSFGASSRPSPRRTGTPSATSSRADAVWRVPGTGTIAGTFEGREAIFRFLARLPKETDGTYSSELVDVLASDDRAAALYRARGTRAGRRARARPGAALSARRRRRDGGARAAERPRRLRRLLGLTSRLAAFADSRWERSSPSRDAPRTPVQSPPGGLDAPFSHGSERSVSRLCQFRI